MTRNRMLALLVAPLALTLGCAGAEDIDRTQPNRLPKSMFTGKWYMRSVVTGVPPTSSASFVGRTGRLEKIVWDIQEKWLIAYRAYEEIPGTVGAADQQNKKPGDTRFKPGRSEGRTFPGNPNGPKIFKENPVAAFPILSHFDVKRNYNPATGEETNVIVENTTDRPWYQREYIRVDWGNSQVDGQQFGGAKGPGLVYYVQQSEGGPDAMRIVNKDGQLLNFDRLDTLRQRDWRVDYFDMVGRYVLQPQTVNYRGRQIKLCYFIRYNGRNYQTSSCGPTQVKVRTAFMRVGERNYDPKPYDDKDMGKFGYFRTERFSYNRKRGFTESGRIYLANRFNIWEKAYETDKDGKIIRDKNGRPAKPIPMSKRVPKPIVYHLTPNYPCSMIKVTLQVAADWNVAFRRAVAVAKGYLRRTTGNIEAELAKIPKSKVPDMFKIGLNGWEQIKKGNDWSCKNLRYDPKKVYARLGDLRYNFFAWVNDRQIVGPLGYGPSSADPETGEIIAGMAHMYGAAVDTYATRALDIVRVLNNDLTVDNLYTGDYVKKYIAQNRDPVDPTKIPTAAANLRGWEIHNAFLTPEMKSKLAAIRLNGLEKAVPGLRQKRLALIKGTQLEQYLLDQELVAGLAPNILPGKLIGPLTPLSRKDYEALSPANWVSEEADTLNQFRWDQAQRENIFLAEFADDSIYGLAKEVWRRWGKSRDYNAMWQFLREAIYRGVAGHEVGHTVGLRHNFAASYDSLNYPNKYWELRVKKGPGGLGGLVERRAEATGSSASQLTWKQMLTQATQNDIQKNGRMREYQYSSIMDYGAKFNSDIHGLGKWDLAAITFAYAGYVEVFDKPSVGTQQILRQRYSDCLPRFESLANPAFTPLLEQWHYSSVWNFMGKTPGITTRRLVPWKTLRAKQEEQTRACRASLKTGATAREFVSKDTSRDLEVPYIFCSDEWVGATVSCNRWDEGADPMEITQNAIRSYKDYYFFNSFQRDRFPFDAFSYYSRVRSRYFSYLPNVYQHWLFRVGFTRPDDPTIANYWTLGTWQGFNLLLDVISRPRYGTYCRYNTKTRRCDPTGDRWVRISSSLNPSRDMSNRMILDRGYARRRYSRYDYESGYYFQRRTLEVGHFWDYLAALYALTSSTGIFVGVETSSDFSRYIVPYYIVFEKELTKFFEGILTMDYKSYGPRIVDNKVVRVPGALVRLINGQSLDPSTGAPFDVKKVQSSGVTLDLSNWFTQRYWALYFGMAEFRSSYSQKFADRHQVFRVGFDDLTPAKGKVKLTCADPLSGVIFGTLTDDISGITDPKKREEALQAEGGAAKMIRQCQREAAEYLRLKAASPTSRATTSARVALQRTTQWLNFARAMYSVYGYNLDTRRFR